MISKKLNFIIRDSTGRSIREARGVLAKLYRTAMQQQVHTIETLMQKLEYYLDDPANGVPRNGKARSSERGNILKEITRPDMTWKVFLKGLKLLGVKYVRFEVHLFTEPGKRADVVSINLKLADVDLEKIDPSPDNEPDDMTSEH